MTNADTSHYWLALRFYSRSWRERHGADMVTMMMDASDNGEDPLSRAGQRSLMWAGLRQRFASHPFVWLLVALSVLSLCGYTWSASRMVRNGLYADAHGTNGAVELWLWPVTLGSGLLLLTSIGTLTVSVLYLPPLPYRAITPAPRGWTAWFVFACSVVAMLLFPPLLFGQLFAIVALVAGVWLYRRTRREHYRVLSGLSAGLVASGMLLVLPAASELMFT